MANGICPHEKLIYKLETDMYYGNEKPGITTRMQGGEDRMDRIEKTQADINTKFWAIILLLATAIITTSTAIVTHAISSSSVTTHSSMF